MQHNGISFKLEAGRSYIIRNGEVITLKQSTTHPTWLDSEAHYRYDPEDEICGHLVCGSESFKHPHDIIGYAPEFK